MARPRTPVRESCALRAAVRAGPMRLGSVREKSQARERAAPDVPEGEEAADLAGVLREDAEGVGGEHGECSGYDGVEERVDGLVVGELGAGGGGCEAEGGVGGVECEREVVVDVGVHAGERELDAVDAGGEAGVEEDAPRR